MYLFAIKETKLLLAVYRSNVYFLLTKKGEQKEIIALISEEAFDQVKRGT